MVLVLGLALLSAASGPAASAEDGPGSSLRARLAARAVASFKDCDRCPEMVTIPAGTFELGLPDGRKTELPAKPVAIRRGFAMSRYEITWDEWLVCVEAKLCGREPDDHEWGRGRMPIMNVSWQDANDFARFLSVTTKKKYRLPTEAEWEYAAKAGTRTLFWWGDEAGDANANCRRCGSQWDGWGSSPVGSFRANPFGLFDMNGNVWEWMADCWNPDHAGAKPDGAARNEGDCKRRVIRSGSWYYIPRLMAAVSRDSHPAELWSYNIGIRVVRELD